MSINGRVLPKFSKAIDQSKLMKKRFSPVACAIDPLFEKGTMNMISAMPNTWKSWLVLLFANNIALGSTVFDKFKTEKNNVIIVNEEDSERLIRDRLRALKIQPDLNVFYRVSRGDKLQTDYVDYLIAEAKKLGVGVIFFDSLRAMHDEDENSSMAMQRVMDLFKKITREGITVIFTHHNKKNTGLSYKSSDAEAIRGSTAINAAISGHISLEEKNKADEKLLIVKHLKSKIGEKLQPFLIKITIDDGVRFYYAGNYNPREDAWVKIKEEIKGAIIHD
jgi:RecA-family ATPase